MALYERTVFELGRLNRLDLLTVYFREMGRDEIRGGDRVGIAGSSEIRTQGMSNEGIITTMMARRARAR